MLLKTTICVLLLAITSFHTASAVQCIQSTGSCASEVEWEANIRCRISGNTPSAPDGYIAKLADSTAVSATVQDDARVRALKLHSRTIYGNILNELNTVYRTLPPVIKRIKLAQYENLMNILGIQMFSTQWSASAGNCGVAGSPQVNCGELAGRGTGGLATGNLVAPVGC